MPTGTDPRKMILSSKHSIEYFDSALILAILISVDFKRVRPTRPTSVGDSPKLMCRDWPCDIRVYAKAPRSLWLFPRQAHGFGSGGAARSEYSSGVQDVERLPEDMLVETHDRTLSSKDIVFMTVVYISSNISSSLGRIDNLRRHYDNGAGS
ncbi:hypothetical protein CPB86DRAFT_822469 [Serendipita vermifera]|nr:hypothetical protein CPB86DRAFT_822469 [Serendipita vermifera]